MSRGREAESAARHPTRSAAAYRQRVATRPVQIAGDPEARWRDHPWLARSVRWAVFLIPVVVSFLFALAATAALPEPDGLWPDVFRWLLIAAASTVVLIVMLTFG